MFKNILVFKFNPDWKPDVSVMEQQMDSKRYVECGESQEKSVGWTEPRGEANGALVEVVGGQLLVKVCRESKVLPGSAVKGEVDKKIKLILETTGRKVGKKEKRELLDDQRFQMLSKAFTKKSASLIWFNRAEHFLVIEAGSQPQADETITLLVSTFEGLIVTALQTKETPSAAMSSWLDTQELPPDFTADRDCVLKAMDESKAVIRYTRHPLDIEEIRAHISAGKVPTQLALTWSSRVSFMLFDNCSLKKIEFIESSADLSDKPGIKDGFDADVTISTGFLTPMLKALIDALGGEVAMAA